MDDTEQQIREQHFADEMGLLFSEMGAPPMMGRIIGHLLICEPPAQSSQQLARALDASKGSISTTTRQLIQMSMIEKVPVPGSRATHFRIRAHAWADLMRARMARIRLMRELAGRGLDLLEGASAERRERLRSFHEFYLHMEQQLPLIIDRWLETHDEES